MLKTTVISILSLVSIVLVSAQGKVEFDGQLSLFGNYSHDADLNFLTGARYIPELYLAGNPTPDTKVDFEFSANISLSSQFHAFDTSYQAYTLSPYRLWMRYSTPQLELRLGLQKIDFGTSTLLRPIQWFNQLDPRDPLQLTNGVYALLARYYFLNNANVWFWILHGNENTRGYDFIPSNKHIPEVGTRVQLPIPKGEIGMSYHFRVSDTRNMIFIPSFEKAPEHRVAIDAKWDVIIGLWVEAVLIHHKEDLNDFSNQSFINLGADYTIGIGNGLNIMGEHMIASNDPTPFSYQNTINVSALSLSYPFGIRDRLSTMMYYNWLGKDFTFLINYEHQFNKVNTYLMAYYNPAQQQGIQQNDLFNQFAGPGVRFIMVFNH